MGRRHSKRAAEEPWSIGLTADDLSTLRETARECGVSAAEVLRNWIYAAGGFPVGEITLDGVTAVTPDYDAELAALTGEDGIPHQP